MTASQAGVSASIFQIAAIAGAVGVPILLRWCAGPRIAVAAVVRRLGRAAAWPPVRPIPPKAT